MSADARAIEFDKNGVPYPVVRDPVTPTKLMTLLCSALSTEYECARDSNGDVLPHDREFEGMSKAEVGAIKTARAYADGDMEANKFIHDRIIGKPKQQIESVQVALGIKDYLKILEDREKQDAQTPQSLVTYADVTPVEPVTVVTQFTLEDL